MRHTITVPEAGRIMGLPSRAAAYRAAKKGAIPTIEVGRRLYVPTAKLEELLGLEPGELAETESVA